jgi:hypothetical protein
MRAHWKARIGLVASFALVFSSLLPIRWALANCTDYETTEEAEFVRLAALNGGWFHVYGDRNRIEVVNRDLNPCGSGTSLDFDTEAHSTSIEMDTTMTKYLEVGWVEYVPADLTVKEWRLFWETDSGGGFSSGAPIGSPEISSYWSDWWVVRLAGTYPWKFAVDIDLDGNPDWTRTSTLSWKRGYAMGETGRTGRCKTGASDHHTEIKDMGDDLVNWNYWPDNLCCVAFRNEPPLSNWDWDRLGSHEYRYIKTSSC